MKLIIQPDAGITPLLRAVRAARKTIDIVIFRLDRLELEEALEAAVARGEIIRGTQVTVKSASGVRTRVDLVTETPRGNVKLIESKNGPSARLTPNQRKALPEIQKSGTCTPCGKNAQKAGLEPGKKIKSVEVQIDRHNQ